MLFGDFNSTINDKRTYNRKPLSEEARRSKELKRTNKYGTKNPIYILLRHHYGHELLHLELKYIVVTLARKLNVSLKRDVYRRKPNCIKYLFEHADEVIKYIPELELPERRNLPGYVRKGINDNKQEAPEAQNMQQQPESALDQDQTALNPLDSNSDLNILNQYKENTITESFNFQDENYNMLKSFNYSDFDPYEGEDYKTNSMDFFI